MDRNISHLEQAKDDLINNRYESFSLSLAKIPLISMSNDVADDYFVDIIQTAINSGRNNYVDLILERWNSAYEDINDLPYSSYIWKTSKLDMDQLQYIAQNSNLTHLEIMEDYLQDNVDNDETLFALDRVESVYGPREIDFYKEYLVLAQVKENEAICNYCIEMIRTISPYAPIPTYVNVKEGDDIDRLEEYKHLSLEVDEVLDESKYTILAKEAITRGNLYPLDTESEIAMNEDIEIYVSLSDKEKMDRVNTIISKMELNGLQSDVYLSRLLGPAMPGYRDDIEGLKYGGARMFLDLQYDRNEDDNGYDDWFTGVCQYCDRKIRAYYHALRQPQINGGWFGCFCSFQCLNEYSLLYALNSGEISEEAIIRNKVILSMISNSDDELREALNQEEYTKLLETREAEGSMKRQIETLGIMDMAQIVGEDWDLDDLMELADVKREEVILYTHSYPKIDTVDDFESISTNDGYNLFLIKGNDNAEVVYDDYVDGIYAQMNDTNIYTVDNDQLELKIYIEDEFDVTFGDDPVMLLFFDGDLIAVDPEEIEAEFGLEEDK